MFGSNHTVRNTLSAAVVGGAAMFSAFSAAGQQVANLDEERQAYMAIQCGHISDAARRTGCHAEAGIRFNEERIAENRKSIAAAQKESAALRTEATCQETIIGMVKSGQRDAVKAAYAGRPVGSVSACEILTRLTKG